MTRQIAKVVALAGLVAGALAVSEHHIKTVWVIVMENQNWSSIKDNKSALYMTRRSCASRLMRSNTSTPRPREALWQESPKISSVSVDVNGKDATGPLQITTTNDPADPLAWRQWHHWNLASQLFKVRLSKGKNVPPYTY